MNKVITINLDGTAYQLEEGGYEALRQYLDGAITKLQGNPDRDEILSDIERAIGEKFRALLGEHKTVVVTKEVAAVLEQMGPIQTDTEESGGASEGATAGSGPRESGGTAESTESPSGCMPKRLYRIREGAMFAGVCNGIAAYVNIDPTFVRLGFVVLTLVWGTGVLVYLAMMFIVPEAQTPEEKAAASGPPPTSQEFIRRAKEGYYEAMKGFPDPKARREWKRRFGREMRAAADQWSHHWHGHWAPQVPMHPGMAFVFPIYSLLHGAATILLICALISLLATGAIFGIVLPVNMPVWMAAFILLVIFGVFMAPLKFMRRAAHMGFSQSPGAGSFVGLFDAAVWLSVAAILLWLAFHHSPELRDALQNIPGQVHQAANDFREWWKGR